MRYTYENTVAIGKPVNVFLNGSPLKDVYECDTRIGFAIVYLLDDEGIIYTDENGDAMTQVLTGLVTVEPIED